MGMRRSCHWQLSPEPAVPEKYPDPMRSPLVFLILPVTILFAVFLGRSVSPSDAHSSPER
jgi:hypothetical protein